MITEKFTYAPLYRETIDGKRKYATPDGEKLPSVTTILDFTKSEESKKALQEWRKRVGAQKAQEITTEAAGRGTRMHKWLETYVKEGGIGTPGTNPYSQQSHSMANVIVFEGLAKNITEFWLKNYLDVGYMMTGYYRVLGVAVPDKLKPYSATTYYFNHSVWTI